uniref:mitogen-activated protein kinase kinase n=1 Tax=Caenorhabditis tropicalis TaxID=1561998 RepID=A0A1I7TKV0_9PELO
MSSGKRRNPLGLSLPPTVNEQSESGEAAAFQEEATATVPLEEQLKKLGLTEPQTQRLSEFLQVKEGIKELSEDMLQTEGELGHGNGGVVNKCVHKKTGVIMARKLVHLEIKPSVRQQIVKELAVLHKCNSPFIVGFYGAFVDNNDISICMEYMDGLSLDIVLKKVSLY